MSDTRDTHARDIQGPDDATVIETVPADVEVHQVVTEEPPTWPTDAALPDPGGTVAETVGPRVVTESERVRVEDDGSVSRRTSRVEHDPVVRRRRRSTLVPVLLIILAIALTAIAAAWYFSRSTSATVPSVQGLALDAAVTRVQDDGFKADITSEPNPAAQGTVFRQSPAAGAKQDKGSTVQLFSSNGPVEVTVPNAVGVSETEARDRLAAQGLEVKVVQVFSSTTSGDVVAQAPPAGSRVANRSAVRLNVSKGSELVSVPSVVGTSQSDAAAQLVAAGLKPNIVQVPAQDVAGTVVAQHPAGGQARRGSIVRLNVSKGP